MSNPPFRTAPLTSERIAQFSAAMSDPNPVHLDPAFARSIGLPGVIAPGGMTVVALAHAVSLVHGPGAIREVDLRFTAPVHEGEQVRCEIDPCAERSGAAVVPVRAYGEDDRLVAEGVVTVDLSSGVAT